MASAAGSLLPAKHRDVLIATGSRRLSPLEWLLPPCPASVVLNNGEPLLASIATCLLLQASILGTGWLLQGWCVRQEPLQGHDLSSAQPWLGAGLDHRRSFEIS